MSAAVELQTRQLMILVQALASQLQANSYVIPRFAACLLKHGGMVNSLPEEVLQQHFICSMHDISSWYSYHNVYRPILHAASCTMP